MIDLVVYLVQMLVMGVALIPHFGARLIFWLGRVIRDHLELPLVQGPYYAIVKFRRRLKDEPEWQPHDFDLGILNPDVPASVMYPPILTNKQMIENIERQMAFCQTRVEKLRQLPPEDLFDERETDLVGL